MEFARTGAEIKRLTGENAELLDEGTNTLRGPVGALDKIYYQDRNGWVPPTELRSKPCSLRIKRCLFDTQLGAFTTESRCDWSIACIRTGIDKWIW